MGLTKYYCIFISKHIKKIPDNGQFAIWYHVYIFKGLKFWKAKHPYSFPHKFNNATYYKYDNRD